MAIFTRRAWLAGLAATGLTAIVRRAHAGPVQDDLSGRTPNPHMTHGAIRARTIAALPYERVAVPGHRAQAEWQRLREAGTGWPVVIGDDEQLDRIAEQYGLDEPAIFPEQGMSRPLRSPAAILEAAAALDFPDDLARWPGSYQQEDLVAPEGRWPDDPPVPSSGLSVAYDMLSGRPLPNVHILMIPTNSSWEVPAYLRWGDWNACPPPEFHVAALRSWHDRHGAELVGINADTMNLRVRTRPGSRADALALARAQYRYCPDIVDQGVGTLAALAAVLTADDWWHFWWD
jgi:uncharacterized protein DUF4253